MREYKELLDNFLVKTDSLRKHNCSSVTVDWQERGNLGTIQFWAKKEEKNDYHAWLSLYMKVQTSIYNVSGLQVRKSINLTCTCSYSKVLFFFFFFLANLLRSTWVSCLARQRNDPTASDRIGSHTWVQIQVILAYWLRTCITIFGWSGVSPGFHIPFCWPWNILEETAKNYPRTAEGRIRLYIQAPIFKISDGLWIKDYPVNALLLADLHHVARVHVNA